MEEPFPSCPSATGLAPIERCGWPRRGTAARSSPRANVEWSYGNFLTWLAKVHQLEPELTPAQRLTPAVLDAFVEAYALKRADGEARGADRLGSTADG